jgi:hypothetical protein
VETGQHEQNAKDGGKALIANSEDRISFGAQWETWRAAARTEERPPITGPALVGCDFGSTTAKAVVLSPSGELLFSCCALSKGNPIEDAQSLFRQMREAGVGEVAGLALTGYGKDLLKDVLGADMGVVAPENIKAGFLKEHDVFAEQGIRYVTPFVSLDEPKLVPKQLFEGLRDVFPGLTPAEMARAVDEGYRALHAFNDGLRRKSREVLEWCARNDRPCLLVLARPYHMDPGIGHEIEVDLQA